MCRECISRFLCSYCDAATKNIKTVALCTLGCGEHAYQNVVLCTPRCAEHEYQNGCSVHTWMRQACISELLLCAHLDAPSMHIKTVALCTLGCAEHAYQNRCSVHNLMRRACISKLLLCAHLDAPSMHIKTISNK